MRKVVFGKNMSPLCRLYGMHDETVVHIVSECRKLAQKGYKNTNPDNTAKVIHWKLCEKWGFPRTQKWFMHKPKKTLE